MLRHKARTKPGLKGMHWVMEQIINATASKTVWPQLHDTFLHTNCIMPKLCSFMLNYASYANIMPIMLYAPAMLLCQFLCWHNPLGPTFVCVGLGEPYWRAVRYWLAWVTFPWWCLCVVMKITLTRIYRQYVYMYVYVVASYRYASEYGTCTAVCT